LTKNWHHSYSSPVGGKDLSNNTQIRVTGSIEPELCTKMLRNLSEKLLSRNSGTGSKLRRRSTDTAKRNEKEKMERQKKKKTKSLKT